MKHSTNLLAYLYICLLLTLTVCQTSTDDVVPDDNKDDKQDLPDDNNTADDEPSATDISKLLTFPNMTEISGELPAVLADNGLKIDKDTIFLVEGFSNRISILIPDDIGAINRSFVYLEGADSYFDVGYTNKNSDDSLLVLFFEFDPSRLTDEFHFTYDELKSKLPLHFKIKIAPQDESGNPVDVFEKPLVLESKESNDFTPSYPGENWFWLWTTVNDLITAAPGYINASKDTTNGCCFEGESVDCIEYSIPEKDWKKLTYEPFMASNFEYLSFKNDGTFIGELKTRTQNLDYTASNFCLNIPAYIVRDKDNAFWGNYSYNQDSRKVTLTDIESASSQVYLEDLNMTITVYDSYYINTLYDYKIISQHFLLEESIVEGVVRHRLFERKGGIVDAENPWYD